MEKCNKHDLQMLFSVCTGYTQSERENEALKDTDYKKVELRKCSKCGFLDIETFKQKWE